MTSNKSFKNNNTESRSASRQAGSSKPLTLCAASAYEQKFYINPEFDALPQQIRDELQILCVMYVEEIGGIFTIDFDESGRLLLNTAAKENDFAYDEIGSQLRIKKLMTDKHELFASLELYYKIFILGDIPADMKTAEDIRK